MRIKDEIPVPGKAAVYSFEKNELGVITHIIAKVLVPDRANWPQVALTPGEPVAGTINNPSFGLQHVRAELRIVEGLLGIYGIDSIDLKEMDQSWIPESEDERASLQLSRAKFSKTPLPAAEFDFVEFNIVAQSVIAAASASDIDVALSFFRRGTNDVRDERYIEAFYDFYFMLESRYADGKWKLDEVKEKFLSNTRLVSIFKQSMDDEMLREMISDIPGGPAEFDKTYKEKAVAEVVEHLVKRRGFLHHHTSRRSDIWHPEDQDRFAVDALILQQVCFSVALQLAEPFVFSEETVKATRAFLASRPLA